MEHLETQVDTLSEENEELHNHIETLEAEIRRLQVSVLMCRSWLLVYFTGVYIPLVYTFVLVL